MMRTMKDRIYEDSYDSYDFPTRAATVKPSKTRAKTQEKSSNLIQIQFPELMKSPGKSFYNANTTNNKSGNKEHSQSHITEEESDSNKYDEIYKGYANTMILLSNDSSSPQIPLRAVKSSNSLRKIKDPSIQNLVNPSEAPLLQSYYVSQKHNTSSSVKNSHNDSTGHLQNTTKPTFASHNTNHISRMTMTPQRIKQIKINRNDEPEITVSSNLLNKVAKIKNISKMDKTAMLGSYETLLTGLTHNIKIRQQNKQQHHQSVEY